MEKAEEYVHQSMTFPMQVFILQIFQMPCSANMRGTLFRFSALVPNDWGGGLTNVTCTLWKVKYIGDKLQIDYCAFQITVPFNMGTILPLSQTFKGTAKPTKAYLQCISRVTLCTLSITLTVKARPKLASTMYSEDYAILSVSFHCLSTVIGNLLPLTAGVFLST